VKIDKLIFAVSIISVLSALIIYGFDSSLDLQLSMEQARRLLPRVDNYKGLIAEDTVKYYISDREEQNFRKFVTTDSANKNISFLSEYIDGAAEIYDNYNFEILMLNRYKFNTNNDAEITVEIYKMKNPAGAFGIYSEEASGVKDFFDIKEQGYYFPVSMIFWRGDYYIKMSSYGIDDKDGLILKKMALEISDNISSAIPYYKEAGTSTSSK
jgi:hypothetical protein